MSEKLKRFHVVPDSSRIVKGSEDVVMFEAGRLEETLSMLFPQPCKYGVCGPGEYSGLAVIDRLIDTDTTCAALPPAEARAALVKAADVAIAGNLPLTLVGIYGTPRHLDHPEMNNAQLADMMAVLMMQGALDRVHSAHQAGAHFRAMDEDLTALWLDINQHPSGASGASGFKQTYDQYFNDRKRLLAVLEEQGLINTGNTRIDLVSESAFYSDIAGERGLDPAAAEAEFLARCEGVRPIFLNFLNESGAVIERYFGSDDAQWNRTEENAGRWAECEAEIKALPEAHTLESAGWQSTIPLEMRLYYLAKFRTIVGNAALPANSPHLLFHVATYLSSTLIKARSGTLYRGLPPGTPIVRVPLVRPPAGSPPAFQSLVPQRTIPRPKSKPEKKRIHNENVAAWSGVAVQSNDKLRLLPTQTFAETPGELVVPAKIYVVASDGGAGSYLVDTAIVLTPKEA